MVAAAVAFVVVAVVDDVVGDVAVVAFAVGVFSFVVVAGKQPLRRDQ